jgi:epoxyqueuosine reductase
MNVSDLTRRVKEEAHRLGFERVGIAPARRSPRAGFLDRWLAAGMHGEMDYLARNPARRANPGEVLSGARSVIVVGLSYASPPVPDGRQGIAPHVSVYARGRDYHDVAGPPLKELLGFLRREAGAAVDGRAYVDTGPTLERDLGARAGIGWVGRNTMLLDRRGSWFFLAEIIVDVELAPDREVEDLCGTCTACVDACPTGALLEGTRMDARRCISYLNIELRGSIPREQRADLGAHLFGCDICQEVCPWNARAVPAERAEFAASASVQTLTLAALLRLTPEAFSTAFRGSPLKRARRSGIARNAAVVLGNLGDREATSALAAALGGHDDPHVRGHAAWALGALGGAPARLALERARGAEPTQEVEDEIERALERA